MRIDIDQTSALTRHAHEHGWVSGDVTIDQLSIAGAGNMNCVLRAELSDTSTLIFKQSLPYVAKYPHIPAPIERLEAEAKFYAAIAKDSTLQSSAPTIIGYDPSSWVLCMQDLGSAQDFSDLYTEAALDDATHVALTSLLGWLSRLHSVDVDDPSEFSNHPMRTLNHEHIFDVPLQEDNGLALEAPLETRAQVLREDRTFSDNTHQLGELYLGRHAGGPLGESDDHGTLSLLHGDFYPGSWVRHSEKGAMIIDPEFSFYGPAEFDIGVMMAHLYFAGMSESQVASLLKAYRRSYNQPLAEQFAGVEITRRLLGVAQLPLSATIDEKLNWLDQAQRMVNQ